MTRKIKRRPRFERLRTDPAAVEAVLPWWRDLGVDRLMLLMVLDATSVGRQEHEDRLAARENTVEMKREIKQWSRALKAAGPLIGLLKKAEKTQVDDGSVDPDPFFGDLGQQVERTVRSYIETLRPPRLAAHRPGADWLRGRVLQLARVLRARQVSWGLTARKIHELMVAAGHGRDAAPETIRHYIRAARKRDPRFGGDHPVGLDAWFAKRDWQPTPNDLGEPESSRRRRTQRRPPRLLDRGRRAQR